jgi:hypothetical protein
MSTASVLLSIAEKKRGQAGSRGIGGGGKEYQPARGEGKDSKMQGGNNKSQIQKIDER